MTVIEACREVGMPRSSFYHVVSSNPEAIAEVQAIIDINNREQLGLILLSKTEMLQKIIEDGLSNTTKPKDRLAIYVKLSELVAGLTQHLQIESETNKRAQDFLRQGPQISHQKSRLTARETTITIESDI